MPKNLYGPQTEKALKNFPISGWSMPSEFICALAMIKEHAAIVNGELKEIPKGMAWKIAKAAREIKNGKHADQFPVDVFQTGSGTSSNMNVNEVIAGLVDIKGKEAHPNDHVNRCQSSNDVVPSAMQVACALAARDKLIPALEHLIEVIEKKTGQFHEIIKTGRTHLMDAVPVRLGDEFRSYATFIRQALESVDLSIEKLCVLLLGGTAAGTGLNAHPQFARKVIARLREETGLSLTEAKDHVAAQSFPQSCLSMSLSLKEFATVLTKIANDIRLMGSGPASGFNELLLPELQAGSSIMPGKVNPVLCESVEQVAAWVIGADASVTYSVSNASRLELCTAFPLIASKLLTSIDLLSNVSRIFADKCVIGIKANKKAIKEKLERNAMLVTALAKEIGYEKATEISKEAMENRERIIDVATSRTSIPRTKLKRMLDPKKMV